MKGITFELRMAAFMVNKYASMSIRLLQSGSQHNGQQPASTGRAPRDRNTKAQPSNRFCFIVTVCQFLTEFQRSRGIALITY